MEVCFGIPADIDLWMKLVRQVSWNFPGLETERDLEEHRQTVLKFMEKRQALCVKSDDQIQGVLLFSRNRNMICCLAVSPESRRKGIASKLLETALSELDRGKDITVSTFREGDEKGTAPRDLYRKFGFVEAELTEEFGYPNQVFILHKDMRSEMDNGKYMKRCYELAVQAGKKGFDTFGAVLVHDGKILEEAENTADWSKGIFGHAEFNLVHKCANRYSDTVLKESVLYTSCAPCERCLCAIASLGVENVVFGVSYEEFSKLTPCDAVQVDREGLLQQLGIQMKLTGPVLEDEGMHVFEWWGGEYRPLEELLAEMAEVRAKNSHAD
jgi:tRNA(Arg) A34 adenosine deaminase TadA/predicted GNAT family acetyltransferase